MIDYKLDEINDELVTFCSAIHLSSLSCLLQLLIMDILSITTSMYLNLCSTTFHVPLKAEQKLVHENLKAILWGKFKSVHAEFNEFPKET